MSIGRLLNAVAPAVTCVAERLNRRFHGDLLPASARIFTLIGLRNRLRQRNLYDAGLPLSRVEDRHESWASARRSGRRWPRHPSDEPPIGIAGSGSAHAASCSRMISRQHAAPNSHQHADAPDSCRRSLNLLPQWLRRSPDGCAPG